MVDATARVGAVAVPDGDLRPHRRRRDLLDERPRKAMPRPALFLAGKSFRAYRAKGSRRTGVLPDCLIGAHAAVLDIPLLTRDAGRYGTCFAKPRLITPKP
jgi:predicted nucleic acid-binding protein